MAAVFLFVLLAGPGFFFHPGKTIAYGPTATYAGLAMSSDGQKLILGTIGGSLYTSTDGGVNWTERTGAGTGTWYGIASSSDGTKLIAAKYGGSIYLSTDSGATWIPQAGPGTGNWTYTASSSDGSQLISYVYGTMDFKISTDSGATWSSYSGAGLPGYPSSMSFSSDATKITALVEFSLYRSTDSGMNWTLIPAIHNGTYYSNVASSGDGSRIAAAYTENYYNEEADWTYVHLGIDNSYDGGASWGTTVYGDTALNNSQPNFNALAFSTDGTKLISNEIYSGMSFGYDSSAGFYMLGTTRTYASRYFLSSDGAKVIAVAENTIYASRDGGVNWSSVPYVLTYSADAHGTLSGTLSQNIAPGGEGTAVTAVPEAGYHFANWSDDSTANPRTDTNVLASHSYTAYFAVNPTYTLTYAAGTHGTLTGTTSQSVILGGSGSAVTAVPDEYYHFVDWSDASTENPRTDVNVAGAISVTANFAADLCTLAYVAGEHGSITGSLLQTVDYEASGSAVTAVPDAGYHFVSWSDSSTANPRTDIGVEGGISVTASFAADAVVPPPSSSSGASSPSTPNTGYKSGGYPFVPPTQPNQAVGGRGIATFTRVLWQGVVHADVKMLQAFLNAHGYVLSAIGPGSPGSETDFFGTLTFDALSRFQSDHALEILTPLNLTMPTGIFGINTMKVVNGILVK